MISIGALLFVHTKQPYAYRASLFYGLTMSKSIKSKGKVSNAEYWTGEVCSALKNELRKEHTYERLTCRPMPLQVKTPSFQSLSFVSIIVFVRNCSCSVECPFRACDAGTMCPYAVRVELTTELTGMQSAPQWMLDAMWSLGSERASRSVQRWQNVTNRVADVYDRARMSERRGWRD